MNRVKGACLSTQVAGIKGMLIANKRQDNQVKTYITYNKGRDWRLLQAPAADLEGNDIHCVLVRAALPSPTRVEKEM